MTLKAGWGWKVGILYLSFVVMIITLVVASSRQKFDLVSKEYYKDELSYQQVLDASHNQAAMTETTVIRATEREVVIRFPAVFSGKDAEGHVTFYSPVSKDWDRTFALALQDNVMTIDRALLRKTSYKMKISYRLAGKEYYMENDINLAK